MTRIAHIFIVVMSMAVMVVCGCTSNVRRHRDAFLLTYTDTAVADMAAGESLPALNAQVPDLREVTRVQQTDEPLSLHAAIESALITSNVVRVSDGGSINASRSTFYDIEISAARIDEALASFDSNFNARFLGAHENNPPNAFFGPGLPQPLKRDELYYGMDFRKKLLTGGQAAVAYHPNPSYLFIPNPSITSFNPRHVAELEFSLRQPLLKDAGLRINATPITIGQVEQDQSTWEFKKSVMASVRSVVDAYWDLYAARQALNSTKDALPLLEEIVRLQKAWFKAKWVIAADVAKAEAELYGYRQQYVADQSRVLAAELRLRNLTGRRPYDGRLIELATQPLTQPFDFSHDLAMDQAMSNNPDLARGRLDVALRKLDLFVAHNDFKPSLDLVALYRMNGVGENLGDAIAQMSTAEFENWEVGAAYSVPIGRRQARARIAGSEQGLVKDQQLLQQTALTVSYELVDELRRIEFAQQQLVEIEQRLKAANEWTSGAQLRYSNPNPEDESATALLEILNDYLRALRARTETLSLQASVIAEYNSAIIQLEETKGTLLDYFAIAFPADPCSQLEHLRDDTKPSIQD